MKHRLNARLGAALAAAGLAAVIPAAGAETRAAAPAEPEDSAHMVPYYTGRIYPTPQRASYSESFAPLDEAAILPGTGLAPDDPLPAMLADRIRRHGGNVVIVKSAAESGATLICLGDTEADRDWLGAAAVPDRPEGYLIHSAQKGGRSVFILKGRDRAGLLWAIVSLNQMITRRDGRPAARMAEVADYPANARRGAIISATPAILRYVVGAKMNSIAFANAFTYRTAPYRNVPSVWRTNDIPQRARDNIKMIGDALSPLGIEWFASINPLAFDKTENQPRCGNEDDFQALFRHAALAAEHGGGLDLHFDDARFPIHPDDIRDFGTAREADIFLLTRLHKALKEKYPKARLLFCPPFYWGPNSPHAYPEPREDYLRALGERLPQDIGIYWTGPRVKSQAVTKEQVQWIADLIRRKPIFWQNTKDSPHIHWYHYLTDPLNAWPAWHYDGFFGDVEAYRLNTGMPGDAVAAWTLTDYLWNPEAYDPAASVREAAGHLFGPESFEALEELNRRLSYFDVYGARATPAAARNIKEMEEKLAGVDDAWKKALAFHPDALLRLSSMEWYINIQRSFVAGLKKNKELSAFAAAAAEEQKRAAAEVKLSDKTDLFLAAHDFLGGHPAAQYAVRCEKRLATWVYGARSRHPSMQALFEIDPFPPAGDYELILCAQDDEAAAACRIRISINETRIFEGPNPFAPQAWTRHAFRIPAAALKRNNTLAIANIEDSDSAVGPPFFMLNYAVLRKTAGD